MKTNYSFWELLQQYKIEIPKIQRDYAQGRKDESIVRLVDIFLNHIKESIINNQELSLDFVYGRVNGELFIPLDGQQRLTTLFLIHWYIALKEKQLTDQIKERLSKFTYETRISSTDFCQHLVMHNIDFGEVDESISKVITNSKWYFLSWQLDPTVAAMLNMLDTIHNKFKAIDEPLFEKLTNETNVTFQFLPLEQFKLTDELYVKMNARGKPLTAFENFKANLSSYLTLNNRSKLDNEWLDIFWNLELVPNTEIEPENVDDKFFEFFKNVTLNFYAETNEIDRKFIDNYNLFDHYKSVYGNSIYVTQIVSILDSLITYGDQKGIFKHFLSFSVNYWERLHFYALSLFFIKCNALTTRNQEIYDSWLRVATNLINNTRIEGATDFQNAIRSIKELSNYIENIYAYISSSPDSIRYFSKLQREEESVKAKLILEDQNWLDQFLTIESHSYFDGQVGFILKYSQKNDGSYDIESFSDYALKLSMLFSSEFKEQHDFIFQRALLTKGSYLPEMGNNYTFCAFDESLRGKLDNWRKVFNSDEKTWMLKSLLDDIENEDILSELKRVVKEHQVTDWRKLLIESPEYISYCQYRQIRWYSADEIYLLAKSQMNGRHKELASVSLFKEKFKGKKFLPFDDPWYWESTSSVLPCIVLSNFNHNKNCFVIELYYAQNDHFDILFTDWNNEKVPETIECILDKFGFKNYKLTLNRAQVEGKINEICVELQSL